MTDNDIADIFAYHERTKHRLSGYAKGPDNIDWDAQPDSFRRFALARAIPLPFSADAHRVPYAALFDGSAIPCISLSLRSIALLLEISVALSAWKQYGSARWSLRCNPSSGNLHPTETYVIACNIDGVEDGVYHYRADTHSLEQRCVFSTTSKATSLYIGFSSVFWREAWKYGERAYRYCQHDSGHALAAVSVAAATLGWKTTLQSAVGDEQLAELLGIDRSVDFASAEHEHPDLLLRVSADQSSDAAIAGRINFEDLLSHCREGIWHGSANVLDARHFYDWPVIDAAAKLCLKPASVESMSESALQARALISAPTLPVDCTESAADLFRRRRSAQAFDGQTVMLQQDFFCMLDHVLARPQLAPWNCLPWQPRIHLVLFVHRVEGLKPGLYALPRHANARELLQQSLRAEFSWNKIESAPEHLPLYQLLTARCERAAATLSCQQAIAGESCFSLAMLAEFEPHLVNTPWHYRELFWEAGAIGQMLYLDAEACGLRATGIGCYFDDAVHETLGITTRTLQSVYHFTVGQPLHDTRIVGLPPYDYRARITEST